MKYLVTGGARSGKSFHAESMMVGEPHVTYVAPGPASDPLGDPEWAKRVDRHRDRRPANWATVESSDLVSTLHAADGAVLIDCLGTWIAAQIDELDGWNTVEDEWEAVLLDRIDLAANAVAAFEHQLVVVTNEVGLGVVPEHRSGRLFRDLLGIANQRVAAECDQVMLVVAGRCIVL